MKITNKQLLAAGLNQEGIMKMVNTFLVENLTDTVHNVEIHGDEYGDVIYCEDGLDRTYAIGFESERPEVITFSTMKGSDDRDEQNSKEFKSITALLNHINRLNKNA